MNLRKYSERISTNIYYFQASEKLLRRLLSSLHRKTEFTFGEWMTLDAGVKKRPTKTIYNNSIYAHILNEDKRLLTYTLSCNVITTTID